MAASARRLWLTAWICCFPVIQVAAHEQKTSAVHPELSAQPAALAGLRIQIHETLAPQLVLENPGSQVLEIQDNHGRVFLRIGAQGVEADLNTRIWYESFLPEGMPPPPEARNKGAAPRWVKVRAEPSWGWYDPRLRVHDLEPHVLQRAGKAEQLGKWKVPVRLGGKSSALVGVFRYRPPPQGAHVARLISPAEIAPGVRLQLLPGQPAGLLLVNRSAKTVTVLGRSGEPCLRVGSMGVSVNVRSPTWREFGRAHGAAISVTGENGEQWVSVSKTARYSWVEPRTLEMEPAGAGQTLKWKLPLDVGGRRVDVEGVTEWRPARP